MYYTERAACMYLPFTLCMNQCKKKQIPRRTTTHVKRQINGVQTVYNYSTINAGLCSGVDSLVSHTEESAVR